MQSLLSRSDFAENYLSSLAESAILYRGVPEVLAREAHHATARNVRRAQDENVREWRKRAQSYFDATVRRMSARSNAPEVVKYRRRVIARLIANDLRTGGVSEDRIEREIQEWIA